MKQLFFIICIVLLSACASVPMQQYSEMQQLFDDTKFNPHNASQLESQQEIFSLSDEAKLFVDSAVAGATEPKYRVSLLSEAIFDRSKLGLKYDNAMTAPAAETFAEGIANCLSMTIMTYSMAKYAGLTAHFISVDVPEYWTQREGFSLLNGHVNLAVQTEGFATKPREKQKGVIIDFDSRDVHRFFSKAFLNKQQIVALFYNNRAAEALIAGEFDRAYFYIKAAAQLYPDLDDTWVNLGILYRFTGHYALSERAYQHALFIAPNNYSAIENMAILYNVTKREKMANALKRRVERARKDNPFYHFILGEEARNQQNYQQALTHYKRAVHLNNTRHEVYFALATTFFELGDIAKARRYLNKAQRLASSEDLKERYSGKLSALQVLANARH